MSTGLKVFIGVILFGAVFYLFSLMIPAEQIKLQPNQKLLTKSMYGDKWALSVDSVIVECNEFDYIAHANGKTYAMNGTSRTHNRVDNLGYYEVEEIVLRDTTNNHNGTMDWNYLLRACDDLCK